MMAVPTIKIAVSQADATLVQTVTLTAGMQNLPIVKFSFSDEWAGLGKTAVVRAGSVVLEKLVVNNQITVPYEALEVAGVNLIIGVYGTDAAVAIPTVWCSCGEILDGTDVNEPSNVGEATPELVDQMIAYAGEIEAIAETLDGLAIRNVEVDDDDADAYGITDVTVVDSGAGSNRTITFKFDNLKGNGIESVTWSALGQYRGRIQITESNGTVTNFDALIDAINYLESLTNRSEAYAIGTIDGVPVEEIDPDDPAYQNNAKYYAEMAGDALEGAETAQAAAETAQGKAEDAQAAAETAQASAESAESVATAAATSASSNAGSAAESASYAAESAINAEESATEAATAKGAAETAQGLAEDARDDAQGYAADASGYATDAYSSLQAMQNTGASASTLPAGSTATATKSVDPQTGAVTIAFGIPKGDKGDTGDTGYPTDAQVATAVGDWLDDNVDPETGYVLDRTLTQSNAAAPADLVGAQSAKIEQITALDNKITEEVKEGETTETVGTYTAFTFDENGYSNQTIPIYGKYKLAFSTCVYDGTSSACTISLYEYDENGSVVASYEELPFWRVGGEQFSKTPYLKTQFFANGGYTDYITPNANASYFKIKAFVNAMGTVLSERVPENWTITEVVPNYKTVVKQGAIDGYETVSQNLFNIWLSHTKETVYLGKSNGSEMSGWYLSGLGTAQSITSSTGIDSTSDAIKVEPETDYWKSNRVIANEFDSNDNWIAGHGADSNTFTTDDSCAFVRLSFVENDKNIVQLLKGSTQKEYDFEAHGYKDISIKGHTELTKVFARNALTYPWVDSYLQEIAYEALSHIGANTLSIFWITDTHPNAATLRFMSLVANMSKLVPSKMIVHTGDIIDGIKSPEEEKKMLTELNRYAQEAVCPVVYCKGNHDDNSIYARGGSRAGAIGDFDDYILNSELYSRTNAFAHNSSFVWGNREKMYGYVDDEEAKIRIIIVNEFDNEETEDGNGKRTEDASTRKLSLDQWTFLGDTALRFVDKDNPSEWAVMLFGHAVIEASRYDVGGLLCAFKAGAEYSNPSVNYTTDFTSQGEMEVIGIFNGDDHYDALIPVTFDGYYSNVSIPSMELLNASLSRDNVNVPTASNGVLMPPVKTYGTETETAFDIVTVNRADHLIYLTRYGAKSYAYNSETGTFDALVKTTRVIDYTTCEYVGSIT